MASLRIGFPFTWGCSRKREAWHPIADSCLRLTLLRLSRTFLTCTRTELSQLIFDVKKVEHFVFVVREEQYQL